MSACFFRKGISTLQEPTRTFFYRFGGHHRGVTRTFDDVSLVEPEVSRLRWLVGLQTHDGGPGTLQRTRGGVRVARPHPARVRNDVANVARALIC